MKKMKKEEKQPLNNALADALANLKIVGDFIYEYKKNCICFFILYSGVALCREKRQRRHSLTTWSRNR